MDKRKLLRLFSPLRCHKCGKIVPLDRDYCSCYGESVEYAPSLCPHCSADLDKCICGSAEIVFNHFCTVFIYDGKIMARMHNLKYSGEKREADFFADAMSEEFLFRFSEAEIDAVTFVPMTEADEKRRGFNQSEIMAKKIAERIGRPCAKLIDKVVETSAQHTLNGDERLFNLRDAFLAPDRAGMEGRTVLLVDDIKTTGATLFQCQQALLEGGAADVYCLTAATSRYLIDD